MEEAETRVEMVVRAELYVSTLMSKSSAAPLLTSLGCEDPAIDEWAVSALRGRDRAWALVEWSPRLNRLI